jgi:DNA replication protein DnaC
MFDINKFKEVKSDNTRYIRRLEALVSEGKDTQHIEKTLAEALNNLETGVNSFVIYGDPQSGKTEMMIAPSGST